MKLPKIESILQPWAPSVEKTWKLITDGVKRERSKVGARARKEYEKQIIEMLRSRSLTSLKSVLVKRPGVRALINLWLHNETVRTNFLSVKFLDVVVDAQDSNLSRLALIGLVDLYFSYFDLLDSREAGVRERLEVIIKGQLRTQKARLYQKSINRNHVASVLQGLSEESESLLSLDGPRYIANLVEAKGGELSVTFQALGLKGYDAGRYGQICRTHFYVSRVASLAPNEWDPVLDELLKPSAHNAPYERDQKIGHVILELLIDKSKNAPSEKWQQFILDIAGDPRVSSRSLVYREWWQPLGNERVEKVRGWLSREDLKLFLNALEEYGKQSGDAALQRMFPARKTFLEGLFQLKLIRSTRLLLGSQAESAVRTLISEKIRTKFAHLTDGGMSDKAVIYLDCGDFYLVEGSHNFKIWVYLAKPGYSISSYDKHSFSHSDLTVRVPGEYARCYENLPMTSVVHNVGWQHKVLEFLGKSGIGLEIEKLFTPVEYRNYLNRYGIPYVASKKQEVRLTQAGKI